MFPFLIGKVLTGNRWKLRCCTAGMFPFLIGKVLTEAWNEIENLEFLKEFPFLIGKVLTLEDAVGGLRSDLTIGFPFLIGKVLTHLLSGFQE